MAQSPKTSLQIVRPSPETVTDRIKALRFAAIPSLLVIVLIAAAAIGA